MPEIIIGCVNLMQHPNSATNRLRLSKSFKFGFYSVNCGVLTEFSRANHDLQ